MNMLEKLVDMRNMIDELISLEIHKSSMYISEDDGSKDCKCSDPMTFHVVVDDHVVEYYCAHCGGSVRVINWGDSKWDE